MFKRPFKGGPYEYTADYEQGIPFKGPFKQTLVKKEIPLEGPMRGSPIEIGSPLKRVYSSRPYLKKGFSLNRLVD